VENEGEDLVNKLVFGLIACGMIAGAQDKGKQTPKREWKIIRNDSTNDCIVAKLVAQHPGYPHQLGTYESQEQANAALAEFKKKEDPNKAGYEMCTNK
jgi:hypothetical protein